MKAGKLRTLVVAVGLAIGLVSVPVSAHETEVEAFGY